MFFVSAVSLSCLKCVWMETGDDELNALLVEDEEAPTPLCRTDPKSPEISRVECRVNESCTESVVDTTLNALGMY